MLQAIGTKGPNAMDQETLKQLAHFKIMLKREKGLQVDLEKLLNDSAYGRQMLSAAEDSDKEELVLLALTLRDKFGHLKVAPAAKPEEKKDDKPPPGKYMHGARS
jgi:hypothetical protein